MTEYRRTKPRGTAEWLYRMLLRTYPGDFRREFGDAMAEFFHDRLARERTEHGVSGVVRMWLRAFLDVVINALPARFDSVRRLMRAARDRARTSRHSPTIHASHRKDWMLSSILQDVRYAVRGMLRQPAFTLVILATLTLGIGANAAIFSVVNGILLHPLPYADADRIVRVTHEQPYQTVSEPEFYDYKREVRAFETVAAIGMATANVSGGSEQAERITGARVSDGFFRILGVRPQLGRTFLPEEDVLKAPRVIVLSDGFWRRRYGADSTIVGKDIVVNGNPRTVIGVMPPRFDYPATDVDAWFPLRLNPDSLWTRNNHYLILVAKLKPGASVTSAKAEMHVLARRFAHDFPETYTKPMIPTVDGVNDALLGKTRPYLYALLGAVAFVLLIACVNVANLFLARGESRRKELALRAALGASRLRVARQVLTESALFAALGGVCGLAFAWAGMRLLVALAPATVPRLDEVRIDPMVLLFTGGITLLTGLLFGLAPAMRSTRHDAGETLKAGGKTGGQARGLKRARAVLVVSEVALAVVTLTSAGLMLRSLYNLQSIDLGIRPEHVLSARVSPPPVEYQGDRAVLFYRSLLERVRGLPGVVSAGGVADLPIGDDNSEWSILIDGAPMTTVAGAPSAMPEQVTPGYFSTMGIPVLEGRAFTDEDRAGASLVAIVNEAMAKKLWPGKSPMGGTIKMLNKDAPWATVVGVVKNVRHNGFLAEVPPTMYFPHAQAAQSAYYAPGIMNLVVKTSGDPLALTSAVRGAVRALEPSAPVSRVTTMQQLVDESVASRRFATEMLVAFAAVALLLAGIGIYGVISYGVTQRTFEIGLRVALGAQREQVLRLVVGEGARLACVGLVIGVAGGIASAGLMRAMFVNVTSGDPVTLGAVVVLLACVALVASWLPARRATRVDPIGALRSE